MAETDNAEIESLLDQWALHRDGETPLSAEKLCETKPELLEALKREIAALERIEEDLAGLPGADDPRASNVETVEQDITEPGTSRAALQGSLTHGLRVRCPHCRDSAELAPGAELPNVECPGCGERFNILATDESTSLTPRLVAQFELIEKLGMGAFGEVWKARDKELDRLVAVKLSRRGGFGPEEAERIYREARSAAQLRHKNIVSVFEVGRDEGSFFIVSELIHGTTLAQAMKERLIPIREATKLCATISAALHHAHEHGVVHRDLKPHNIMLDQDGDPHLLDFGLAKREWGEVTLTMDGAVLGTPSYMSPEQARGEGHQATRATDIYSLGVILFEIFTGSTPFRGDIHSVLAQIIDDEPPVPSRLESRLPRDLETICLRCLEKNPLHRYATALAVHDDLQNWLHHRPIMARPISRAERAGRWVKRHPAVVALTLGLLLLLAVGLAVVSWQWLQVRSALHDRSLAQVDALINASPEATPQLLGNLPAEEPQVTARLQTIVTDSGYSDAQRSRARIALLPYDPSQVEPVLETLLRADIPEALLLRDALGQHLTSVLPRVRTIVKDSAAAPHARLIAASCLPSDAPSGIPDDSPVWGEIGLEVVKEVANNPSGYQTLGKLVTPIAPQIRPSVIGICLDEQIREQDRQAATSLVSDYLLESLDGRVDLLTLGRPWQFKTIFRGIEQEETGKAIELLGRVIKKTPEQAAKPSALADLARRQANAAIALIRLDAAESVRPLLSKQKDPSARRRLVNTYRDCGGEPERLLGLLATKSTPPTTMSVILTLGTFDSGQLPAATLAEALEQLRFAWASNPELGVREAAGWTLRRWGELGKPDESLSIKPLSSEAVENAGVQVTGEGHTLAVVKPHVFRSGATDDDQTPNNRERPAMRFKLSHCYAIATCETTIEQYQRYDSTWSSGGQDCDDPNCPVYFLSWQRAAGYCNWLSEQEGVAKEQWCYVTTDGDLLVPAADAIQRTGFRLPTEPEWECACRAGTETPRFFGWSTQLLPAYAVGPHDSTLGHKLPVATKMPNDWGLFDTYGNVDEICHDFFRGFVVTRGGAAGDLTPPSSALFDLAQNTPKRGPVATGFRVARTIEPSPRSQNGGHAQLKGHTQGPPSASKQIDAH